MNTRRTIQLVALVLLLFMLFAGMSWQLAAILFALVVLILFFIWVADCVQQFLRAMDVEWPNE